ncbi:nuclear transport factor 2 family protein [Kribbella sp. NBC_00382]|uniref:nuclear transport factor 2 family protein n=1 Tax=Kribbella sp. NBC_00382 TaxID=2975967 RepID=UPI002E1CB649
MTDEQAIRSLIERWATAVHAGELAVVLEDHADDIVMFDVPPPYSGVRGLDAYRETWPGFFEWQASGAVFEIESLSVTAGVDVAFAFALLRCGQAGEFPDSPTRLRLTLGLRKESGRWVVTHEHHSFPSDDSPASEVRELQGRWSELTAAKDLDGLMDGIAEDVVSYEHGGQMQYVGKAAVRAVCAAGLEAADAVSFETPDLRVETRGDLAVTWGLDHVQAGSVDSWSRATRVFQRRQDGWKLIHQHLSFPHS